MEIAQVQRSPVCVGMRIAWRMTMPVKLIFLSLFVFVASWKLQWRGEITFMILFKTYVVFTNKFQWCTLLDHFSWLFCFLSKLGMIIVLFSLLFSFLLTVAMWSPQYYLQNRILNVHPQCLASLKNNLLVLVLLHKNILWKPINYKSR